MKNTKISKQSSQKLAILAFLEEGNTITPLEALAKFGSFRLGARIYDLKQDGYLIGSNTIETINGSFVSEYFLEAFRTGLN